MTPAEILAADSAIMVEVRFRADEQARWERFFVAALQGTAAAWRGEDRITHQNQVIEAVDTARCLADEAVRVADERAESRRKGGGAL